MKKIFLIIGVIVMLISGFLPYATATESNKRALEAGSNEVWFEPLNMKNKDAIDISLFEYGRIYHSISANGDDYTNHQKETSTFSFVVLSILAVVTVLELIFSITQKWKTTIVFCVLSILDFLLIRSDFSMRGIVPSSNYNFGIATYVYAIGCIIVIVGAIIQIKEKHKIKNI